MAKPTKDKKKLVDALKLEQESTKTNKYRQVLRKTEGDVDYEIHEYVAPTGVGYQILTYSQEEDGEYVKSEGFGVEAESRTFDWTLRVKE